MSESNIYLGTSGWSYNEWEGPFYQKGEKRKLRAYSSIFKIVEIDSTFYRNPSKGTVMGWLKYSPSMRPLQLGGKLGCFLIQLPPKCDCNMKNLESFFGLLDPQFKYARVS